MAQRSKKIEEIRLRLQVGKFRAISKSTFDSSRKTVFKAKSDTDLSLNIYITRRLGPSRPYALTTPGCFVIVARYRRAQSLIYRIGAGMMNKILIIEIFAAAGPS
jgi:hypothetical protein